MQATNSYEGADYTHQMFLSRRQMKEIGQADSQSLGPRISLDISGKMLSFARTEN
jgi:hypothetical protein